jgi:hypothetical protein
MHILADKVFVEQLNKEFGLDLSFKEFKEFYQNKVKPARELKRAKNFSPIDPSLEKELMRIIK